MEYFEFKQSYKRRKKVTSRRRVPDFCDRYKIDIGIYNLENRRFLPRSVKQKDKCLHTDKNHYCVLWKETRQDSLLNRIKEIDRNLKSVKNIKNEIIFETMISL